MECPICAEQTDAEGYCLSHQLSFDNLKRALKDWTIGYGKIPLDKFLQRLLTINATGLKAKEVIQFLLENPTRWKQYPH